MRPALKRSGLRFFNPCGDDHPFSVCMAFCLRMRKLSEKSTWFSGANGSNWGWTGVTATQDDVLLPLEVLLKVFSTSINYLVMEKQVIH